MKKFIILLLLINSFSLPNKLFCQGKEMRSEESSDKTDASGTNIQPRFYTNSNLFIGAEIIDPLKPEEFFTRATQLWKTDVRIGMALSINKDIIAFFAVRDNDSPRTNDIHLYEAGVKINHKWGLFMFGQQRLQAGISSYYLNEAFDRSFWDQGLIYDFILRGASVMMQFNSSELAFFLGSQESASFVGGIDYGIDILPGWKAKTSVTYVARDPKYSAFGGQFGIESEESYEHFFGYQVISFKVFDQEPKPFRELTLFAEGRFKPDEQWSFGAAGLFRRLMDLGLNRDELRVSIDARYQITKHVLPGLQAEYFELANFKEIHLGVSVYFQYLKGLQIVPRIRYIITEFGPDIAFFGLEGKIIFGEWE